MAGFEFGAISYISVVTGTECFVAVVLFLLFLEYVLIGVNLLKEFFPSSYLMLQKIFKELMIMGIVSFSIVMLQSSQTLKSEDVILAIESAHILLFFKALFYVANAIFLIKLCALSSIKNRNFQRLSIEFILHEILSMNGALERFLFNSSMLPGSQRREMVEFKVYEIFFKRTYSLSEGFSFADYLNGCNQKRCIRLLDVGVLTWIMIIVLSLLNYARVKISAFIGISCSGPRYLHQVDVACTKSDLKVLIAVGFLTSAMSFGLLITSRIYDLRYNIAQHPDYCTLLS